jgi:BirA family biotin operon repressor/biotin-[acetyl-CoA-carboxylase] ligase
MHKKSNKNLIKIVNILQDGQYHDGTTIGHALQMTRSAVWKAIKKLQTYGIKFDSIKGRGYALLEPLILLEADKIKENLEHENHKKHENHKDHKYHEKIDISVFESLDSSSEYLKAFKHHNKAIKICLTEQQTQGKGRFNREWVSPFSKNIYMSCLYPFHKDVSELSGLSLVVGLAILKTLKDSGIHEKLFVKWPNDIICENKKISGTLIEIQAETHGSCHAIIGVGVNVNMLQDPENKISQAWTSMRKILNVYTDRNKLCANLINRLLDYLQRFNAQGLMSFVEEWNLADCLTGKMIDIKTVHETIRGEARGINEQGHLILKLADGKTRAFSSGDTTLAKTPALETPAAKIH